MSQDEQNHQIERGMVNPGYAALQLAKALTTSEKHADPEVRARAQGKVEKWGAVLGNILTGGVDCGSRNPVSGVPAWATLEVVTGGFATGALLAGGPLQDHEIELLKGLPHARNGSERRVLNGYFLTDAGLGELRNRLKSGCYDIRVPEEGTLLVIAWLVENGHADEARPLVDQISPWLTKLRFYPIPREKSRYFGPQVHLQDVRQTIADMGRISPNLRILAQKESVEIWAAYYDRLIALFMETVVDDWPCHTYPGDWSSRANELLCEYPKLRKSHKLCGKPEKAGGHFAQLRKFLAVVVREPTALTGRDIGRIKLILRCYLEKRGQPSSERCANLRDLQRAQVSAPSFYDLGKVVSARLAMQARDEGLDEVHSIQRPIDSAESQVYAIPAESLVPESIQRKVERCLNATVAELVELGLITSGEMVARVLPQMTSALSAAGIADPSLRRLYAAIYQAFRRRRSLLLRNLQKQVQIEELPWISAIDRFRNKSLAIRDLSAQALEEATRLVITAFPYAILPNKLLQELRALAKDAGRRIPLVDEVAADIFMGEFSGKFVESAERAADVLEGSLYATYFGIDYRKVRRLATPSKSKATKEQRRLKPNQFAELCAIRAGVSLGTWDPATNGMIIEQQQILTTQNLAFLFSDLGLIDALQGELSDMAMQCFHWICERQQMKIDHWHARLTMVKNTAYAWRQMLFFLALLPKPDVSLFLQAADEHLGRQRDDFVIRFRPAFEGLCLAVDGISLDEVSGQDSTARRFLGWSKQRHWLLNSP
ncbi:MAG: hypothetical protein V4719_21970 [Planctomycetota bacterium]